MSRLQRSCHPMLTLSLQLALGAASLLGIVPHARAQAAPLPEDSTNVYPDAPSALLAAGSVDDSDDAEQRAKKRTLPPCPPAMLPPPASTMPSAPPPPCAVENRLRIVVNYETRQPLTSREKGILAFRDVVDPFNLIVIGAEAGFGVGFNAHSAYGPGLKGFGRLTGYELLQDTQGEFFGTYLIPSLTHEDPRYRRMQNASVKRRIFHALVRTVIAQHDDGRPMLNYATLLTYPISAELSNLYVPGVQDNAPSTLRRIGIGLATDPAGNLIAEFLPDIARRIHVRSIFVQQIVNTMALQGGAP